MINLKISNSLQEENVTFHYQYSRCYNCIYMNVSVPANNSVYVSLLLNWMVNIYVTINDTFKPELVCKYKFNFESDAKYVIQNRFMTGHKLYEHKSKINCTMVYSGTYDYLLPLYVLLIILCFCGAFYYTILMLYRHRILQRLGSRIFLYKIDLMEDFGRPGAVSSIGSDNDFDSNVVTKMKTSTDRRLKGLDCFRGISIVLMIFVNYGGGGYWFFQHSIWNGITLADFVFPWFVFVMGVTLAVSLFRAMSSDNTKRYWAKTWLMGCKRTIILFLIGLCLESSSCKGDLTKLRIMGPLQRLAIAYFCLITIICIVSPFQTRCKDTYPLLDDIELLNTSTDINSTTQKSSCCKMWNMFADICFCWPYILLSIGLLLGHACVSLLVQVPGCPKGYLGPGGFGDYGCCVNCTGGVAGHIDRIVLKPNHMYQNGTSKKLYHNDQVFDPEGILGYLNCTALCFLGFWAGNVMLRNNSWSAAVKRLVIYAVLCTAIGVALCEGRTDGGFIPINKNLWSVSFVLITAGASFLILAFMFTTVDVLKVWNGSPFRYPGMNPLVIYCGHTLLERMFPVQWDVGTTYTNRLTMNVWGAVFWTTVGYLMFIKRIFITV